MRDFPHLVFHAPAQRNISELVFVETLPAEKLLDRLPHVSGAGTTETTESTEVSQDSNGTVTPPTHRIEADTAEDTRTFYHMALRLRRLVADSPPMPCPWPPTSADFNLTEAKAIIPLELYNFLSWVIDASQEPTLKSHVDIDDDLNVKVLSICQDIVYLASRGQKQTPKALCLGLTVRHLSGSSQLVSLLNRLGHSASWDTIVRLDTSLAQLQLVEGKDRIPKGFSKKVPTTIVWDNIDFGEETLSRRGTTHHTNGIRYGADTPSVCEGNTGIRLAASPLYCPIDGLVLCLRSSKLC